MKHSLWVGGIAQAKGSKFHALQTSWAESSAAQCLPKDLAVGGQVALAGGGDGDEDDIVLQQLLLQERRGKINDGGWADASLLDVRGRWS